MFQAIRGNSIKFQEIGNRESSGKFERNRSPRSAPRKPPVSKRFGRRKLPGKDVARYPGGSFLRFCLPYRVDPVYSAVPIELSSRHLSARAVCSCWRMQRSRPAKENAAILAELTHTSADRSPIFPRVFLRAEIPGVTLGSVSFCAPQSYRLNFDVSLGG